MLNVREATHKQILENAEINNVVKIMGLQYKKKYESISDLKSLRYGKLMIMTDQDQDGSHIKGLLINFIHYNWPSLLKLPFLEEFITPIVKVTKGKTVHSFYSLPEFEEWKNGTSNWSQWKVKYYKGLGTSTTAEAKEYFSEISRHRITFKYTGPEDDQSVMLAFSKKMVEQRKDWLTQGLEERKRRREEGLSEIYLYEKNTRSVTYKEFVNKELILFSNMDNERSIPSLMDGLKPGQRKVLFTCLKRNDKREVKVAQLAGSVGEISAYHHGEASLMSTIINLAQDYVGSNNINLLQPIGQFGTRLQGGKDAASPRYIFTMLSSLARRIFDPMDGPLLNYLFDDNLKIEPEWYCPIIPMVLVNGAEGIGTGWSTKIPNYNPREIVANLLRMINGEEPLPMMPWFKGFRGQIDQIDTQRFVCSGVLATLDDKSFEVTELPIRTWTQVYKETTLETFLHGNEKNPTSFITDYKEYHTDTTVRFVISLSEANLKQALTNGIHKTFKLQSTFTTTSMVLFDHNGCLRRYDSPMEILREFFTVRKQFYAKRKQYYEGILEAEALKLANQARFILEKNDGKIKMENVKRKDFYRILVERNYDSDPVKEWKKRQGIETKDENEAANEEMNGNESDGNESEREEEKSKKEKASSEFDYDYLLEMTMRSMLREKVDELLKKRDVKKEELEKLRNTTPDELWQEDLRVFSEELDKLEELEKTIEQGKQVKLVSNVKGLAKKGKSGKSTMSEDAKPSPHGITIEPRIDLELKKAKDIDDGEEGGEGKKRKNTKKAAAKKDKKESDDENDDTIIIGADGENVPKKPANPEKKEKKLKQSTLPFQPSKKAAVENVSISDIDMNSSDCDTEDLVSFDSDSDADFAPKKVKKQKVDGKKKANKGEKGDKAGKVEKTEKTEKAEKAEKSPLKKKSPVKKNKANDENKGPKPKKVKKASRSSDESDFSSDSESKPKQRMNLKKKGLFSDSEDEELALNVRVAPRDPLPSRARATAKYVFSDSE